MSVITDVFVDNGEHKGTDGDEVVVAAQRASEKMTVVINQLPNREDIDLDVEEHLIVELYSK